METAKLQFKVGSIEFIGEGEQMWVALQLDKILDKVPSLLQLTPQKLGNTIDMETEIPQMPGVSTNKLPNLATWLKDKNAMVSQVRKFLATAAHLQLNGKSKMRTGDVGASLKNSNQSRLNNLSDCLNQNVKKGFCEKSGSDFFVTSEGLEELGIK